MLRNTRDYYLNISDYASRNLIDFALKHAGKEVLDIGCSTGEYIQILNNHNFKCVGVDLNPEYIVRTKEKNIEAYIMNAKHLEFPNKSFDTVLLFEVLEHIENPIRVLREAKRVARRNILITTPNCTDFFRLKRLGLTYEHMLDMDHINFFSREDLEELLSNIFNNFTVEEREPVPFLTFDVPKYVRYMLYALHRLVPRRYNTYFRLYAIAEVE